MSSGVAAWEGMSGMHSHHLEDGVTCAECHGDTTADSRTIADAALHVDGDVDLALPSTIIQTGATCTGFCHTQEHEGRSWWED
jgi:hypothetical protein